MVGHIHIAGSEKTYVTIIAGVTWRFALGFAIERNSISFEFGPAWICAEW